MQIQKLAPSFHERVWGSTDLRPWFPLPESKQGVKIGEVWFDSAPADLPLLKFLFTNEKLSVQVHPADAYARAFHGSRGKTEMWYILAAEDDARIAVGFREAITKEHAREAALTGEIENLLQWHDANPGDVFFIPAGTVHAIGAGMTICEIQQRSDITYRLYDYGRPRELHLDHGFEVAHLGPADPRAHFPIDCEYFRVAHNTAAPSDRPSLFVVISGKGTLNHQNLHPGDVYLIPAGSPQPIENQSHLSFLSISA